MFWAINNFMIKKLEKIIYLKYFFEIHILFFQFITLKIIKSLDTPHIMELILNQHGRQIVKNSYLLLIDLALLKFMN